MEKSWPGRKRIKSINCYPISCTNPYLAVWKPDELRNALMPTLEKLYRQEPESLPFRQRVDPLLLNIPVSWYLMLTVSKKPVLILSFLVFKPDELRQALMPTLERLYKQDPESIPFRQPVDPLLLQIPVSPQAGVLARPDPSWVVSPRCSLHVSCVWHPALYLCARASMSATCLFIDSSFCAGKKEDGCSSAK